MAGGLFIPGLPPRWNRFGHTRVFGGCFDISNRRAPLLEAVFQKIINKSLGYFHLKGIHILSCGKSKYRIIPADSPCMIDRCRYSMSGGSGPVFTEQHTRTSYTLICTPYSEPHRYIFVLYFTCHAVTTISKYEQCVVS